jgi:hypothetical protein
VGSAIVLRAWVPDLDDDIVRPARAAGHPDAAIASLAGPLTDLADALTRRRARPRPR